MFQHDGFQLGELVKGLEALLAAVTGFLDAAERKLDAPACAEAVDENLPAAKPARHPELAASVARPERGHKPVIGRVGEAQRLAFLRERDGREHRPEDFLAGKAHLGRYVADQRRRHEKAGIRRPFDDGAAREDRQLGRIRLVEESLDPALLPRRDQRPAIEVGVVRADAQGREFGGELIHELLIDRLLDQQARTGRAGLPGVLNDGVDRERQDLIEVGIREHDLRRLAAEFERHADVVVRGGLLHHRADFGRTGEGDEIDLRMRRQRGAGFLAGAGDEVERAGREADIERELANPDERKACVLGGLDDAGVARRERASDRTPENLHRVVPRHDMRGDAERLAQSNHGHAREVGDRLAMELVGRAAVELEIARGGGDVCPRLLHRLAAIARFEVCQFLAVVENGLRELHQQASALESGKPAPGALVEGLAGGLHREVDIRLAGSRDPREHRAGRGFDHGVGLAGKGRLPGLADEVLIGFEPRRGAAVEGVHRRSSRWNVSREHAPGTPVRARYVSPPAYRIFPAQPSSGQFSITSTKRASQRLVWCPSTTRWSMVSET